MVHYNTVEEVRALIKALDGEIDTKRDDDASEVGEANVVASSDHA